ncbi:MAG: hypothetical protein LBP75_10685 [Planctomycetota bacterium]|jgi:hypothetical protein|nr:hypothetical protein [Planctomycetota bacterium]
MSDDETELERQIAEVNALYTNPDGSKRAGWLKTPTGNPTQLSKREWLLTRTSFFKKKFGEWEAALTIGFAERAWNGKTNGERISFLASDKLKSAMRSLWKHSVEVFFITDSDIRHIKKHHGANEGLRGQADFTPQEVALIPWVVNEFDTIEKGETGAQGNETAQFTKRVNGTVYVVGIERGTRREQILTAWKKESRQVPRAGEFNHPLGHTSETTPPPSTDMIQKADSLRNAKNRLQGKINPETGEPLSSEIQRALTPEPEHEQELSR